MPTEAHYRKLENMYMSLPVNLQYEPQITISQAKAEITIPVSEQYFHAADAVHGMVYFKLMDDTAFMAANSLLDDVFVLTTNFQLYFLRPVSSGQMRAVGKVVSQSKNQIISESIVFDSQGREISRGSGTFVRSRVTLTPEMGYK
jgi:uncharacterized protein (TIGR00369 family)